MSASEFNQARWFAEQVQPHEPMLRAWLLSRVVSRDDVDDIVQEAYVRVLRAKATGPLQSPKAFLFAVARNLALDRMRHQQIARTEPLVETEAMSVLDEGIDIPEAVARSQELSFLTEAIQSLPDRCRQVFTLRKVYGLSQQEIARRLGISEHTVSAQLTIGIRKCTQYVMRRREHGEGLR